MATNAIICKMESYRDLDSWTDVTNYFKKPLYSALALSLTHHKFAI